jgi:plasmid stabilization system protein ParE
MKIVFLPPAKDEFLEAITYYNNQSEGLGYEFAAEVKRTLERIVQYPDAWFKLSSRTQRCRTNRFPYGVIYQVREKSLLIVAVMHLSREPKSWKLRLKKKGL